jgi:hypothetical protein
VLSRWLRPQPPAAALPFKPPPVCLEPGLVLPPHVFALSSPDLSRSGTEGARGPCQPKTKIRRTEQPIKLDTGATAPPPFAVFACEPPACLHARPQQRAACRVARLRREWRGPPRAAARATCAPGAPLWARLARAPGGTPPCWKEPGGGPPDCPAPRSAAGAPTTPPPPGPRATCAPAWAAEPCAPMQAQAARSRACIMPHTPRVHPPLCILCTPNTPPCRPHAAHPWSPPTLEPL